LGGIGIYENKEAKRMAYAFWGRLGITKGEEYQKLLERAWNLGWSQRRFFREARAKGLGYTEKLMREDWHRFGYVRGARTYEGKITQHIFFDEVVKKLHDKEGWSWKEIKEFLNERKDPRKWTPETKVKEKIYKSYLKEALPEKADT